MERISGKRKGKMLRARAARRTPAKVRKKRIGGDSPEGGDEEKRDFRYVQSPGVISCTGTPGQCLVCYKTVEIQDKSRHLKSSEMEGTFTVMFILKKLLSVPNDRLARYLKEAGPPKAWIVFCKKCVSLVEEAVGIQKEIGELEGRLRNCQAKMIAKIRETWSVKEDKMLLKEPEILATHETRKLVVGARDTVEAPSPPTPPLAITRKRKLPIPEMKTSPSPPTFSPLGEIPGVVPIPETYEDDDYLGIDFDGAESNCSTDAVGDGSRDLQNVPGKVKVPSAHQEILALKSGKYSCHLCPNVKDLSATNLVTHVLFHFKKPLKCSQCNCYYSSKDALKTRPFKKITRDPHKCSARDLIPVKYEPKQLSFWKCALCPATFDTDKERDLHEDKDHDKDLAKVPRKKHQCRFCTATFRNLAEWRLHRALEHPSEALISCYYCDLTFQSKTKQGIDYFDEEAMLNHVTIAHRSLHPNKKRRIWTINECPLCGCLFSRYNGLNGIRHHVESVHGVSAKNTYPCPVCPSSRLRKEKLKVHFDQEHRVGVLEVPPPPSPPSLPSALVSPPQSSPSSKEIEALTSGEFRCAVCPNLPEMSANKLVNHVMFHYKRPFKCSQCDIYYSTEAEVVNRPYHKLKADGHQCSIGDLIPVQYAPDNLSFWKCDHCQKTFNSETERDLHEKKAHGGSPQKRHKCNSCPASFRNLAEWRLHRALEHPEVAAYSCQYCDLSFKAKSKQGTEYFDEEEMIRHQTAAHKSLNSKTNPLILSRNRMTYECPMCGSTSASTLVAFNDHIESVHGVSKDDSFPCPVCPARKHSRQVLNGHFVRNHRIENDDPWNICDTCGYQVKDKVRFLDHQFREHGLFPDKRKILKCSEEGCSYQCVAKKTMDIHVIKEHGGERKIKCRICGQGFMDKGNRWAHEKLHLNKASKPFQCEICGNSYAIRNHLYMHNRLVHLNRPFPSTRRKGNKMS